MRQLISGKFVPGALALLLAGSLLPSTAYAWPFGNKAAPKTAPKAVINTTTRTCGLKPSIRSGADGKLRWHFQLAQLKTLGWNLACYNTTAGSWQFTDLHCRRDQKPTLSFNHFNHKDTREVGHNVIEFSFSARYPVAVTARCEAPPK